MTKRFYSSVILSLLFIVALFAYQDKAYAATVNLTEDLETGHSSYDMNWGEWDRPNIPFTLTNGEVSSNGFGIDPYYSSTTYSYADFFVGDYNNTTLDTTISLEKEYSKGDYGESEVIIYADHKKIYTKHFTNKTDVQHIKVGIPEDTQNLTFYVLNSKGSKGTHGLLFIDPKLTDELPSTPKDNSVALWNLDSFDESDYDLHYKNWDDTPFENVTGAFIARTIGLQAYYSSTTRMFVEYNIGDYSYTTLETKISLDQLYKIGDLGTSQVEIYADSQKIYTKKFTNKTGIQNVKVAIPKGTKYLSFYVLQKGGNQGKHRILIENPILTNAKPTVKKKKQQDLWSLGTSETTDYSVYKNKWDSSAFEMNNGQMIARGYGFYPYYSSYNSVLAKFYIGDFSYKKFQTTFSIDKSEKSGSRGSTTVQVYAGTKQIYSKKFTNTTKIQKVNLTIPKKTKKLTVKTIHKRGKNGTHAIVMDNPVLIN